MANNGPPISAASCGRYEHRMHKWQEKVWLVGQDVGGVMPRLGGVFAFWKASCARGGLFQHFGPLLRRSVKGRNTCAQFGNKQR